MRTNRFSMYGRKLSLAAFLLVLLISGQRAWTQEVDTAQIVWTTKLSLSDEIWAAKFFANGDSIVVVEKNRVFVMDARTGKIGDTLNGFFSPHRVIMDDEGNIYNHFQKYSISKRKVIDTLKFEPYGSAPVNIFEPQETALNPTNNLLFLQVGHTSDQWGQNMRQDSNLALVDRKTMRPIYFKTINGFMNQGMTVSPNGKYLVTGELNTSCCYGKIATSEVRLELRNPETLDLIKTIIKLPGGAFPSFDFSPDSKYFVATTTSDSLYIWETDKWELRKKYYALYIGNFGTIIWSKNSNYLILTYSEEFAENGGYSIYKISELKEIKKLNYYSPFVNMENSRPLMPLDINDRNQFIGWAYIKVNEDQYSPVLTLIQLPEFVASVGNNNTTDNDAILYPNPTNGKITINFNEELTEPTNMELSNETGRILFSTIITTGTREYLLNTRELPEGMYICNVRSHNFTRTYKIMVVR